MKKEILILSFFVIVALLVSGCTEYPGDVNSPQNSPKKLLDFGGWVEDTPLSLRLVPDSVPFTCSEGLLCRKNNGAEYNVPCYPNRRIGQCELQPSYGCAPGDWWVSGICQRTNYDKNTGMAVPN